MSHTILCRATNSKQLRGESRERDCGWCHRGETSVTKADWLNNAKRKYLWYRTHSEGIPSRGRLTPTSHTTAILVKLLRAKSDVLCWTD